MAKREIFLASMEAKDAFCLEPLVSQLEKSFDAVRLFSPYDDIVDQNRETLEAFAKAELPVVVVSSVATIDTLNLIRPRETYICIGVEHGIAPFKAYTYGRGLLASDFYLAPTRGWAERLVRLYPDLRAKVRLGGYPKIEAIRDYLRQTSSDAGLIASPASPPSFSSNILVLLSWGVKDSAIELLPDYGFIDYLLHPADSQKLESLKFQNAKVHVSRPEITYPLIAGASLVLGDFSSLTLECIALGKRVSFLIDPCLYDGSCDLEGAFATRESAEFGKIPFTTDGIPPAEALTVPEFLALATEFDGDIARWHEAVPRASIGLDYLPPVGIDNRDICAAEINDIVDRCLPLAAHTNDAHRALGAVDSLCFLSDAFPALLCRAPDRSGLRHYLPLAGDPDANEACAKAVAVCQELNRSSEGAKKRGMALSDDPTEKILAIIGEVGKTPGSGRACNTLDALNEQVLPAFYRLRRDEAVSDAARIRFGAKLAASRNAKIEDFVELADAYAREERLSEALCWIAKAIDARPLDGELLRFKASVLERLGMVEQALVAAEKAKSLGADTKAISPDIIRLHERCAADLRRHAATGGAAGRLACYVKLVSIGAAELDDLVHLAQACADEEELADALFWISKAIELSSQDGELLRFRASIFERLGMTQQALDEAERAKYFGANLQAISSDIARLRSRLVAELRERTSSSDFAEILASHSTLLRMGEVGQADLIRVAAKAATQSMRLLLQRICASLSRTSPAAGGLGLGRAACSGADLPSDATVRATML